MKKFLNHKIITFIVMCLISMNLSVEALTSDLDSYRKIISGSGISYDTLPLDLLNNSKKVSEAIEKSKKNFLMLESKQVKNNFFNTFLQEKNYKLVIFICNSEYQEAGVFSCNSNESNFDNTSEKFIYESIKMFEFDSNKSSNNTSFNILKSENLNILVLNESLFYEEKKKEALTLYLASIKKSSDVKIENPSIQQNSFKENLTSFRDSFIFELLFYSTLIFIFFLFFGKILIYLNSINFSLKKIDLYSLISLFEDFVFGVFKKNIFSKFFYISIFVIFIFLSLQYIRARAILYGIGIDDVISANISKIQERVLNFNPALLFIEKKYSYLVVFSLLFFGAYLILFSRIETLSDFLKKIFLNIKTKEINLYFFKYLFLVLIAILGFLILLFSKSQDFDFLFFVSVLTLFVLGVLFKFNIDLKESFSIKIKITLSAISIIFPLIVFFIFSIEAPWKNEKLIGVNDKLVMLPYKKKLGENFLIEKIEHEKFLNYPIFINEYLVHYPEKNKIQNLNIKNFKDDENFVIVGKKPNKIFESILTNNNIIKNLPSNPQSNVYFIEYLNDKGFNDLLEIEVDCENLSSKDFRYTLYYLDNSKLFSTEVSKDIFFGCEKDTKTYYFEKPKQLASGKNYIIEVLQENSIKNLGISISNEKNESQNMIKGSKFEIKKDLYYYVKSEINQNSDSIYNYYVSSEKEYKFENELLNERINKLILDKSLDRYFNIWTLEPLRLIKNQDD